MPPPAYPSPGSICGQPAHDSGYISDQGKRPQDSSATALSGTAIAGLEYLPGYQGQALLLTPPEGQWPRAACGGFLPAHSPLTAEQLRPTSRRKPFSSFRHS